MSVHINSLENSLLLVIDEYKILLQKEFKQVTGEEINLFAIYFFQELNKISIAKLFNLLDFDIQDYKNFLSLEKYAKHREKIIELTEKRISIIQDKRKENLSKYKSKKASNLHYQSAGYQSCSTD